MTSLYAAKVATHHTFNNLLSSLFRILNALTNSFLNKFLSKLTFVRICLVYSYIALLAFGRSNIQAFEGIVKDFLGDDQENF